jgi:predicted glutamine amidotransferase
MCRVLFAVGNGEEMAPLVDAFVRASEKDPYKEARGKKPYHGDGWGYVLFKNNSVRHYRSLRPVFEDENGVKALKGELDGFVILMAHSRAISQGEKSLLNTQPFAFSTRRGFSFWLYHNGDLDKAKIIEMAEFERKDLEGTSDSYTMGAYLCRRLGSYGPDELLTHYSKMMGATNTSLNTGSLFLGPKGDLVGFVTAYSRPTYIMNPKNWDYVRQIAIRRDGLFAVASSTLELYLDWEWEPVVNGTAFYVRIDPQSGEFEVESLTMG